MWPAFPASDYYDSSAPPHRHRPTTAFPSRPAGCRIGSGTGAVVPVFTVNRLTGEVPSYAPATSSRLRRRPSP